MDVENGALDALTDWLSIRGSWTGPLFVAYRRGDHMQDGGMSTTAIHTMLKKRAEKAGWIQRNPDEQDQRVMRVYLTEDGRAIRGEMEAILNRLNEEALDGFTVEERVLFRRFLQHARDHLRKANTGT